jgi:DinB superfamily
MIDSTNGRAIYVDPLATRRLCDATPGVARDRAQRAGVYLYGESTMNKRTYVRLLCCGVMTAIAASSLWAQSSTPGLAHELVATWERAAGNMIDVANAMPEERYDFKPTPEVRTFREQLVHVAGTVQRFIDTANGTKGASDPPPTPMTKVDVVRLLTETFQAGKAMLGSLTDAQMVEPVKFPFGDRMVSRYGFWMGPLLDAADHYGQLVIYLRLNGIVPPATARRAR